MSLRTLLLKRLTQKPNDKFEEILFRLEDLYYSGLRSQISAVGALNTRAMQLIDFLQQDHDGLDHLVEQLGEPFTVSCAAIVELEALLQRARIPEDTVRRVFDTYLESLEDQANWELPDYAALWEYLFSVLLDPAWMKSSGQHHLLQFIGLLAPHASPRFTLQMRNWVRKTAKDLGVAPPFHADDRLDEKSQPYLLLELSTEGNYYNLRVRFMRDPGKYDEIYQEKLGFTLDDLPRHLGIVLKKPAITSACLSGNPPVLEFFLPVDLLNRDLDQWWPSREKESPLSTQYGLVVRAGPRLWDQCWIVNWGRYWKLHCGTCRDTRCETADDRRTAWLTRAKDRRYHPRLHNGQWIFCLHFTPDSDCFEALLDAGVAVLLWPRQRVTAQVLSELKTQLAGQTIRDLPEWLRQWRRAYWDEYQRTGSLSLLWDDPQRLPPEDRSLPPHPDL